MKKLKEEFFKILPPTIYFFVALRYNQYKIGKTIFDPDYDIDDSGLPHEKLMLPQK